MEAVLVLHSEVPFGLRGAVRKEAFLLSEKGRDVDAEDIKQAFKHITAGLSVPRAKKGR